MNWVSQLLSVLAILLALSGFLGAAFGIFILAVALDVIAHAPVRP